MVEYGPQRGGRPERVSSQPHRAVQVPAAVETPAEISTVQEIVVAVTERLMAGSRANLRSETRPLKISIAGLGAMLVATCGYLASEVRGWDESRREQWTIEQKQGEQDEAMAAHLDVPHVTPKQILDVELRLKAIEDKIDEAIADKAPANAPVKLNVKSRVR